jgi:hypothetical protein
MKTVFVLAAALLASPALADPMPKEYVTVAMKTSSFWSCAVMADYADNREEVGRLLNLGYETGKTLVEEIKSGRVEPPNWFTDAWLERAPWVNMVKENAPSTDFVLGRAYQSIREATWKDVWSSKASGGLTEKAEALFRERNCSFLK